MAVLAKRNISAEEIAAIQSSLPNGQAIRHLCPAFGPNLVEYYLVATNNLVGIYHLRSDFALTPEQLLEKQALESIRHGAPFRKRFASSKFVKYLTWDRVYNDLQVRDRLIAKYGDQLILKYEVTSSKEFFISEVAVQSYQESFAAMSTVARFKDRKHQIENLGSFELVFNSSSQRCHSFFESIRDIFKHIRDVNLGIVENLGDSSRVTKCLNCGSTELTVKGTQVVCDFCQSKYVR
jgi:hypothetical protein